MEILKMTTEIVLKRDDDMWLISSALASGFSARGLEVLVIVPSDMKDKRVLAGEAVGKIVKAGGWQLRGRTPPDVFIINDEDRCNLQTSDLKFFKKLCENRGLVISLKYLDR
ncbi:hypothetical protein [Citrobacter freundii]|uniref:hypothetical protein n=1 Tax=Citrobacter freundii TaxID=546 RepID=UPI00383B33C0